MLASLIRWIRFDDSELGAPNLPGCDPCSELGRPMMLLNVLTEICNGQSELRDKYKEHFQWAVEAILRHVRLLCLWNSYSLIAWYIIYTCTINLRHTSLSPNTVE